METHLAGYIRRFFSGTLLSRVSGMGRDLAMAAAFGDHPSVAAFMVAFRLSNLFRRLLGEGPLQSAFIPHFEGLRVQNDVKASLFFRKLVVFIALLLVLITLAVEGGIGTVFVFTNLSEGNSEVLKLTAWLFPGLLFICLYGLNISLLNCYNSFFIPSVAPAVCNMIWIAAVYFLRDQTPALAMISLAKWVVIGFFGQWLLTVPLTLKYTSVPWKEWFFVRNFSEVWKLTRSFSLGAIGVGAVQINALSDALFARYADIQGPVYLWYSIRLEQLALAIFGIACVSTIVPSLSRAIKANHLENAQVLFSLSYKRILLIMIPCAIAIFAIGFAAVNLIYGRGSFPESAVLKTTSCLCAYGLGLLPTTLIMLFSAIFYAQGNFRTPMWASLFAVVINLGFNSLFVFGFHLGAVSTALATSLSCWINCLILFRLLTGMGWKVQFSFNQTNQIVFASLFGFLSAVLVDYLFFEPTILTSLIYMAHDFPKTLGTQLNVFVVQFIAFVVGFCIFSIVFKIQDITDLFKDIFSKDSIPSTIKPVTDI